MKKGFFRRGMVLLLAAVMVMGMSVSAFAADGGNATQVTIADGDMTTSAAVPYLLWL